MGDINEYSELHTRTLLRTTRSTQDFSTLHVAYDSIVMHRASLGRGHSHRKHTCARDTKYDTNTNLMPLKSLVVCQHIANIFVPRTATLRVHSIIPFITSCLVCPKRKILVRIRDGRYRCSTVRIKKAGFSIQQ